MVETELVQEVMGDFSESLLKLSDAVNGGLPKSYLRTTVRHVFPEPADQIRFLYRVVPEATFKRRQGRLSPAESERTERLARVIATAEYCLEDKELARQFLTSPHWNFSGKTPLETALTELGARQVEELLFGMAFGLPA